jgi:hypothetical protein
MKTKNVVVKLLILLVLTLTVAAPRAQAAVADTSSEGLTAYADR